ncbi:MAG: hypothetical protein KJ911_12830 [Alphaproteobacteria bacterium]|jgi:hypothetical protein|uniref:Uncharacterized protein n=1 Tax=Brevundimonas mediterranea TaxID=74329 RepID=A0A7Z8Y1Z8_9CAUL|nr:MULTISPECIES: hypothetical protein [Brevundimonas]MBU4197619.1 hypothetical protein [Alphaproteobacteria bacterium]OGN44602.1 MAG: hypothetical protein A2093_10055 [Caulobacterales bacterium GWE1_67_11]MCG2661927.1 hypothetical protein [Brevundimonas sp.]PZN97495.1 MAG: hypothetical protein DCF29_22485 [Alphaproteobacteria bacterium]VDC49103.1 hypothetical protein BREV_BREV_03482 [Brevundimonas mediterranea]
MTDRAVRNLEHLRGSASTARVLNLLRVWEENGDSRSDGAVRNPDWAARPVFRTHALNRSLIIKHRLRRNETDLFTGRRQVATKVVIPIDDEDLKTGGRYVFVNQIGFERMMIEAFGVAPTHPDIETLRLIDKLPSLDPFLLREQLRRGGLDPAPCYFSISDGDLQRMVAFVHSEVEPLVTLSLGADTFAVASDSAARMAAKILSNTPGDQLEALRLTLRLAPEQYQEGVFCWKGFLYYKWTLSTLLGEVAAVAEAVRTIKPSGRIDRPAREYLDRSRAVLRGRIIRTCDEVSRTLSIYDDAYARLTQEGRPTAFRDFLLDAPSMFAKLGDQLGAVQHIVSYWRFRFGPAAHPANVEELMDIFMDFETGLLGRGESPDDIGMMAA